MPVESLLELAKRSCVKYGKHITDIGPDCPYDLIREALLKIESPEQLHQLELKSPQIVGLDGEIWLQLIKRDIPEWQEKLHEPSNPKNWWKEYRKLKQQAQDLLEQGAEKLKAALDDINHEKEQNLARLVTRKELPGPSIRQRMNYGYASGRTGSKGASRLSLMEKIRKEARDTRYTRMAVPNHELKKLSTKVSKAPQGLLEDYKRSAPRPQKPIIAPRAPRSPMGIQRPPTGVQRPPTGIQRPAATGSERSMQEREARLKALKEGKVPLTAPPPGLSLDGPSSPKSSSAREQQRPSTAGPSSADRQTVSSRQGLSADFLESHDMSSTPPRNLEANHTYSPARFGSPRPAVKRKEPPSLFMSSKKVKPTRAEPF